MLQNLEDFLRNCHTYTKVSSMLPKYNMIHQFFFFPLRPGAKFELSPLVDYCQITYLTKLKNKTLSITFFNLSFYHLKIK
jgi:hypothetical protein